MDILGQFRGLIAPKKRQVAKITGGAVVVLEGEAQIGQSVYYDAYTREIEGQAPDVQWVEISI